MLRILLIEDNPGYIALTVEAFKESRLPNQLEIVEDGQEAMDFLRRRGQYENSERPDIILLDLNLPKKDGREVLSEIKGDPALKRIPVIVLTTSKEEEDVVKAYESYANCYIRKPEDLVGFWEVVRKTEDFWLTVAKLPPVD
jgi:chemotaxis family two-component system response regulator Rcp1